MDIDLKLSFVCNTCRSDNMGKIKLFLVCISHL